MEEPGQLCEQFRHHHEYNVNRAGLSEETLVADDRKLAECLKSLTTELPFEIFLASVTKEEENGIASRYGQDLDRYPDDDEVIDHREWKMYRDEEEDMDNAENSPEPGLVFPVTERIKVFQTTKRNTGTTAGMTSIRIWDQNLSTCGPAYLLCIGSEIPVENDAEEMGVDILFENTTKTMISLSSRDDIFEGADRWETNLEVKWIGSPNSREQMDVSPCPGPVSGTIADTLQLPTATHYHRTTVGKHGMDPFSLPVC